MFFIEFFYWIFIKLLIGWLIDWLLFLPIMPHFSHIIWYNNYVLPVPWVVEWIHTVWGYKTRQVFICQIKIQITIFVNGTCIVTCHMTMIFYSKIFSIIKFITNATFVHILAMTIPCQLQVYFLINELIDTYMIFCFNWKLNTFISKHFNHVLKTPAKEFIIVIYNIDPLFFWISNFLRQLHTWTSW